MQTRKENGHTERFYRLSETSICVIVVSAGGNQASQNDEHFCVIKPLSLFTNVRDHTDITAIVTYLISPEDIPDVSRH